MKRLIPLICLLIIVFISSGQSAEQQSLEMLLQKWLPDKPLEEFLSLFSIPYWGIQVSIEERGYYAFIEFLIRKGTHFVFFGILSLAVYYALPKWKYRKGITIVILFFLAIADELRQSMTPGRTASMQDVLLDTSGAATAMLIVLLIQWRKSKLKLKKNKSLGQNK